MARHDLNADLCDASRHDRFMDLLQRHQNQVFGYIFAAVRNLHDAEELYQETSLVLWQKFGDFQPGTDFARWACRTARFKVLHFHQDKRRRPVHPFAEDVLASLAEVHASRGDLESQHHQEVLAECVSELPVADQHVVELCYGTEDSIKQVAEKMQRAPKTLYNTVSRIRRALFLCVHLKLTREEN